jgi:hypothetical protein
MGQVRQTSWVTVRVDGRGTVVWCDDWAGLLLLVLRGHPNLKPRGQGRVVWVG